jgi:hypothetical protein
VILERSLHVKMDAAFQSFGCVISIMTAEMTRMNPLICAGKALLGTCESLCVLCFLSHRIGDGLNCIMALHERLGTMKEGI